MADVKSCHVISEKCSRYRDTAPTDPSLPIIYLFTTVTTLTLFQTVNILL